MQHRCSAEYLKCSTESLQLRDCGSFRAFFCCSSHFLWTLVDAEWALDAVRRFPRSPPPVQLSPQPTPRESTPRGSASGGLLSIFFASTEPIITNPLCVCVCVYPVLLCCCLGASPDSSPPRTGAAAWRAGGELGQDKCVFLPVPRCHVAGSYKLTESTVRFAFENVVRGMGTTVHSREGGSPGRAFDLAELREEPASKFSNMQHLVRILHEFYLAYHTDLKLVHVNRSSVILWPNRGRGRFKFVLFAQRLFPHNLAQDEADSWLGRGCSSSTQPGNTWLRSCRSTELNKSQPSTVQNAPTPPSWTAVSFMWFCSEAVCGTQDTPGFPGGSGVASADASVVSSGVASPVKASSDGVPPV